MPRSSPLRTALATAAALLIVPAATAQASVVTTPGSIPALTITAADGEDNRMNVDCEFSFGGPSTCVVEDYEGVTENSDLCVQDNSTKVTCTGDPMTGTPVISLGDLDDYLDVESDNFPQFTISTGTGDDVILGADGGAGDEISAGPGDDWVEGQYGGDTIHGDSGRDTIIGGAGYNVIYGDSGNDTLMSGAGLGTGSTLYGGFGNDHLIGGWAADKLVGLSGNDLLDGGRGNDDLDGGADVDTVDYQDRTEPVTVDIENDQFDDGNAADNSYYDESKDRVRTSNERILGGSGGDTLRASATLPVTLDGGGGNDLLFGSSAVDVLLGGTSSDTLDGKGAGDTLNGGDGADVVDYRTRTEKVAVRLDNARNDGADPNGDGVSTSAEEGDVTLNVEGAYGGAGADYLRGNALVNRLSGFGGADRIRSRDGTTGVDVVACGTESDTLDADASDTRTGCETLATVP